VLELQPTWCRSIPGTGAHHRSSVVDVGLLTVIAETIGKAAGSAAATSRSAGAADAGALPAISQAAAETATIPARAPRRRGVPRVRGAGVIEISP
jgi:hypothetical protein